MIFSKGRLPTNIHFKNGDKESEIGKDFVYLGINFRVIYVNYMQILPKGAYHQHT
jgi:hypothetical protein